MRTGTPGAGGVGEGERGIQRRVREALPHVVRDPGTVVRAEHPRLGVHQAHARGGGADRARPVRDQRVEHLAHRRRGGELGRQPGELGGLARRLVRRPGPGRACTRTARRACAGCRVSGRRSRPRGPRRSRAFRRPGRGDPRGGGRPWPPGPARSASATSSSGACVAPVVEGAEQDRFPGADHLRHGPPLVQRHLGRRDDDPRVRAHRPTEPQHVPVAVDRGRRWPPWRPAPPAAAPGSPGRPRRRCPRRPGPGPRRPCDRSRGPTGGWTRRGPAPAGRTGRARPPTGWRTPRRRAPGPDRRRDRPAPPPSTVVRRPRPRGGHPRTAGRSVAARTSSPSLTVKRLPAGSESRTTSARSVPA